MELFHIHLIFNLRIYNDILSFKFNCLFFALILWHCMCKGGFFASYFSSSQSQISDFVQSSEYVCAFLVASIKVWWALIGLKALTKINMVNQIKTLLPLLRTWGATAVQMKVYLVTWLASIEHVCNILEAFIYVFQSILNRKSCKERSGPPTRQTN